MCKRFQLFKLGPFSIYINIHVANFRKEYKQI